MRAGHKKAARKASLSEFDGKAIEVSSDDVEVQLKFSRRLCLQAEAIGGTSQDVSVFDTQTSCSEE